VRKRANPEEQHRASPYSGSCPRPCSKKKAQWQHKWSPAVEIAGLPGLCDKERPPIHTSRAHHCCSRRTVHEVSGNRGSSSQDGRSSEKPFFLIPFCHQSGLGGMMLRRRASANARPPPSPRQFKPCTSDASVGFTRSVSASANPPPSSPTLILEPLKLPGLFNYLGSPK
jgi:hypothetical protein